MVLLHPAHNGEFEEFEVCCTLWLLLHVELTCRHYSQHFYDTFNIISEHTFLYISNIQQVTLLVWAPCDWTTSVKRCGDGDRLYHFSVNSRWQTGEKRRVFKFIRIIVDRASFLLKHTSGHLISRATYNAVTYITYNTITSTTYLQYLQYDYSHHLTILTWPGPCILSINHFSCDCPYQTEYRKSVPLQ